ncbi:3-hydroxyacyl-CoA dehydrogenase/enoyl-CoA hydratase family protein [Paracoccus pantotrophus]|uniref:3-hydroxyacyl-CoA dehydrogenase/enoyl-CoA hydratase family protein n=1 Tax=Paracoccus pantotrophus TaxID=82367 RepID=UPI00048F2565|nr:3-hydroxyacyl-CoA dehydrogenase/enoyl-CoA hydratase family protein [Paracoccus pantotrophus]
MITAIEKVAVLGAGVMGAGIAAHLTNAGVRVVLLDVDKAAADAGIRRAWDNGGFMDPAFAARIATGSTVGDLSLVADADWIVEALPEQLALKQSLYRQLQGIRKPGSILSSNTSTIPLAALVGGMAGDFAADFLITHFFNPPRRMRLLELVAGPATRPEIVSLIGDFCDRRLGKDVVSCRDTPGFIANRIGNYWMIAAQNEAIRLGLDIEDADAIIGRPFGIPATGIFGLMDLVGIDLVPTVIRSLQDALPPEDAINAYEAEPPIVGRLIAEGRTGRKVGAGYFRRSTGQVQEVMDLKTGGYRAKRDGIPACIAETHGDPRKLMEHDSAGGEYARRVMQGTLAYAAKLAPEIAEGPDAVDDAMRGGYGWNIGPFEMIDRIGPDWLAGAIAASGEALPPYLALAAERGGFHSIRGRIRTALLPDGGTAPRRRTEGALSLGELALSGKPCADNGCAALWNIGEGVACLEIRTKMNTLSPALLEAIDKALDAVSQNFRALVIGSDALRFSAGADLSALLRAVETGGLDRLLGTIHAGQQVFTAVKRAPFPVVGAAAGIALGGGCELLLHCDAIQAHADLQMGLVETKVGLIPGWGGCKELLLQTATSPSGGRGPAALAASVFDVIANARVSSSAFDARKLGYLRPSDNITMNLDRLLADARQRALELADGYAAPQAETLVLAGPSGLAGLEAQIDSAVLSGRMTAHDRQIGLALAGILTGGAVADPIRPLSEDELLALEAEAFIELFHTSQTRDRIDRMLATGTPLRN